MKIAALVVSALLTATCVAQTGSGADSSDGWIEVVNAGREPRKLLRFDPPINVVDKVEITVREKSSQMANGVANPDAAMDTGLRFTLRAEVVKKTEEGSEIALEVLSVMAIDPGEKSTALKIKNDALAKAKGAKGVLIVAPVGAAEKVAFTPDGGSSPAATDALAELGTSLVRLFTLLPEEPVGLGASWVLRDGSPADPANVNEVLRYTLQSSVKDRFVVASSGTEPLDVSKYGLDRGVAITYQTRETKISGDCTIVDGHAFPLKAGFTTKSLLEGTLKHSSGATARISVISEQSTTLKSLQSTPVRQSKQRAEENP